MKRIALVIPGLDKIGGAEKQVMLLARGLSRRGWLVSVVCLSGTASAAAGKLDGVDVVLLEMRHGIKDPRGWMRFVRWLRKERPAIVHAHLPHASWLARWASLLAPVPLQIDTIHTSATGTWGRRIGYRLSRWIPKAATAVSESAARSWLAAGMVSEAKLTILPNGVEIGESLPPAPERDASRRKIGLSPGFEWLAVGRLEAVKDFSTMLKAFVRLPQNARLSIAGAGSDENNLRRLASELGIDERVRWLGFVEDLRPWLSAADGFVQSSLWEGLPLAMLEAEAHGLPVVATDAVGVKEGLPEESARWLAPVGDAQALADAMQSVMSLDCGQRAALRERNFRFVRENFDLEIILDRWEKLYGKLLGEK